MLKRSLFALCALVAGCATWTFAPVRSARFVSENGDYLYVDYGREEHESTFVAPSGVSLPFKTKLKVRVTAPDGRRFVAWQVMSPRGVLYKTDNEHWEYYEEGTGCILAERASDGDGYELRLAAVRHGLAYATTIAGAQAFAAALEVARDDALDVVALQDL